MELIRQTPLHPRHVDNHARIVNYSGFLLPIEYESSLKEAKAVRTTCGLFDVSHMGEIKIEGRGALKYLQKLTTNDLTLVAKGQLQYNLLLNSFGCAIDDIMVYNLGHSFLCVVNASNVDRVYGWLKDNQTSDVDIIDETAATALLALQGPNAAVVLEKALGKPTQNIKYMHFIEERINGERVVISRSGYTGEDGYELYCPNSIALLVWDALVESGKKFGLQLCGLGSRDILRIEAGYPLYGHELATTINPFEASLSWAVKMNKDFIGRAELHKIREESRIQRKRVGFILHERAMPRQGYPVYSQANIIGEVSSGAFSPNLDKFIGMAFIETNAVQPELPIELKIRDRYYKGELSRFPFVPVRTRKH